MVELISVEFLSISPGNNPFIDAMKSSSDSKGMPSSSAFLVS